MRSDAGAQHRSQCLRGMFVDIAILDHGINRRPRELADPAHPRQTRNIQILQTCLVALGRQCLELTFVPAFSVGSHHRQREGLLSAIIKRDAFRQFDWIDEWFERLFAMASAIATCARHAVCRLCM